MFGCGTHHFVSIGFSSFSHHYQTRLSLIWEVIRIKCNLLNKLYLHRINRRLEINPFEFGVWVLGEGSGSQTSMFLRTGWRWLVLCPTSGLRGMAVHCFSSRPSHTRSHSVPTALLPREDTYGYCHLTDGELKLRDWPTEGHTSRSATELGLMSWFPGQRLSDNVMLLVWVKLFHFV